MNFVNVVAKKVFKGGSFKSVRNPVDLQSFRPDAEKVRAFKVNPSGSGNVPLYDYQDGKIPKDDTVTDLVVQMRSGRFDKAEISQLRKNVIDQSKRDAESKHSKDVAKALDSVLGIDSGANASANSKAN